ncbi:hypothetical protein [Nannocystis sp.]|uniref:hypothetical protein n=1 Tax=Nannocystis sp. TaxID=1962667 RepID=UPI0026011535|nr:hypothetical protein [Nannocystis sp.]
MARARELAASTGSACHAGHGQAPAVLLAMGVAEHEARGALRLSSGQVPASRISTEPRWRWRVRGGR